MHETILPVITIEHLYGASKRAEQIRDTLCVSQDVKSS